ncbi:class I SAM-dependent methyltransferase [Haladaptatus caseinilyticus]|uniref:class I SAM-dependent methyltransferase n=1 Tax=Haladaptatus caseinilyticus TaxID=2993314 RepID=UPI00224A932C|nr:class I SAM-dependent methyltransferase [Haladaptatus caseinilyticus]
MDDFERKRTTTASFGDIADAYLDSDVHQSGADLELLVSWCSDASRALDIACGAGHTAGALAERVKTVIAADATPAMVETATAAFDLPGTVADAERLPFADDSFDAVTCRIAAHHFPAPQAFLDETARVLTPGGVLAFEDNVAPADDELADFYNRFERLRDSTHGESYTVEQWLDWFRDAGFTIDESVTMRKELDYESWVERTNPAAEKRERLNELVRRPAAETVYNVTLEVGTVRGFSNEKLLVRARR